LSIFEKKKKKKKNRRGRKGKSRERRPYLLSAGNKTINNI